MKNFSIEYLTSASSPRYEVRKHPEVHNARTPRYEDRNPEIYPEVHNARTPSYENRNPEKHPGAHNRMNNSLDSSWNSSSSSSSPFSSPSSLPRAAMNDVTNGLNIYDGAGLWSNGLFSPMTSPQVEHRHLTTSNNYSDKVNESREKVLGKREREAPTSDDSKTSIDSTGTTVPSKNSKSVPGTKPSHSYIALISMAILNSKDKRILLGDIYEYIMREFPYYKNDDKAWKNSIRHNLSLNECFIKNGRAENGKGNYWSIHPACIEDFSKGDFRRRHARRRARRTLAPLSSNKAEMFSGSMGYVPMTSSALPISSPIQFPYMQPISVHQSHVPVSQPVLMNQSATSVHQPGLVPVHQIPMIPGYSVTSQPVPYFNFMNHVTNGIHHQNGVLVSNQLKSS